jgi:hypothetical protein
MQKIIPISIIIFFTFTCFLACTKEVGYPEPKKQNPTSTNSCDSSNVTYTNFVANVMSTNCTLSGCHNSGSSNGDLTSYALLKLKIDDGSFYNRVLVQKDMPPGYSSGSISLDDCSLGKLKKWINNGAPQ